MLDVLYYPVSAVMWCWHQVFGLVLGPASSLAWGLSVVFLVLTLRALMIKPFMAQVRVGYRMQAIAPQLAELRTLHAQDKQKLLEETQKLQREHGVNPLGGCLPLLIQLPVFLALLHVLSHFNRPGLSFEQNAAVEPAEAIWGTGGVQRRAVADARRPIERSQGKATRAAPP